MKNLLIDHTPFQIANIQILENKQLGEGKSLMTLKGKLQEAERQAIMIFNKMYEDLRGKYVNPKPEGVIPMDKIRKYIGTDE